MSFVKIGHHTSEAGRTSPEEAGTTISEPSNRLSVGQVPIQEHFCENPGLQYSSSLGLSASPNGERSGNDFSRITKHNEHINHHEVIKPQETIPPSPNSLGNLPPYADHLHEPGVRRRSSSPLSSSSEEIIIFSGRKRAKNKTPSATNKPISRDGSGNDKPGFINLTNLSSLIDPPSISFERTSKPSRSISPEYPFLGTTSFMKEGANLMKRGRAIPDDPNPTGSLGSKKTWEYEVPADHVINTHRIHEHDGSRIDQGSVVSDDSSTDSLEFQFSSREHMAHVKSTLRDQKNRNSNFRLGLRRKSSPELAVISIQVSDLSVYCMEATKSFQ